MVTWTVEDGNVDATGDEIIDTPDKRRVSLENENDVIQRGLMHKSAAYFFRDSNRRQSTRWSPHVAGTRCIAVKRHVRTCLAYCSRSD